MQSVHARSVRSRRLALTCGSSLAALALATPAHAQCVPEPTTVSGTTTCTGTDSDGLRVTTSRTTVQVVAGATVTASARPAIAIDIPPTSFAGFFAPVNIAGQVRGIGQTGISIFGPTNFNAAQLVLTIAPGGSLSGTNGVRLVPIPGNQTGTQNSFVYAQIDNAGTISGTSGYALFSSQPTTSGFNLITNRASGVIGAIFGPIGTLNNAGRIEGGALAAIDTAPRFFTSGITPTAVTNSGTITSNAASTIVIGSNLAVSNTGLIQNGGGGSAISGNALTVTNGAGGRVLTAGSANAIDAVSSLQLTNAGTIVGNLFVAPGVGPRGSSVIDSTNGTVSGNLRLGDANDTLVARYQGSPTLFTGISGTIDGGLGTNTVRIAAPVSTTINTPIALPTNFQLLSLAPSSNATITLAPGFVAPGTIRIIGQGSIVNTAALTFTGAAFVTDSDFVGSLTNAGSIVATGLMSPQSFAINAFGATRITNSGTITVSGGGGIAQFSSSFENSGTITARDVGVNIVHGLFSNSGTIVSTSGTGVVLFGNVGVTSSNNGIIRGATNGVSTNIFLTNFGTIASSNVGVEVQPYGYLINAAGGIVDGAVTVRAFNAGVANAGTINGNVTLNGAFTDNSLSYIALRGGVLNGNLALGTGSTLVTSLLNTGSGQFAGITGTVTAGTGSTLRYSVNTNANATLPVGNVGPFATAGYQLSDGALLTLTAPASQTRSQTLLLAGTGSVDLNATIAVIGAPAIRSTIPITSPGGSAQVAGLSIINRGALTLTRNNASDFYLGAVSLSANDSFTNVGSITVSGTSIFGYGAAAISGGANVTNVGRILLNGGVGVSGGSFFATTNVSNSGTIEQVSGGVVANGVTNFGLLTNTGTISVGGFAAQFTPLNGATQTLVNSGVLRSTGGAAVTNNSGGSFGTQRITNQTGGIISGVGRAIEVSGAVLVNAGTITGTVDLGYAGPTTRGFSAAGYTAAGGTIAGNLLFGSNSDTLTINAATTGISGTIDGGLGFDTVVLDRSGGGVFGGAINFERLSVLTGGWRLTDAQNYSAGTTIATGAALTTGFSFGGSVLNNGTLTFDLATNGAYTGTISGSGSFVKAGSGALTFSSQSYTGATSVTGGTLAFTGTLASREYAVAAGATLTNSTATTVSAIGASLSIVNAGTIANTAVGGRAVNIAGFTGPRTIAITNLAGGVITSADDAIRIALNPTGGTVLVDNFGTIQTTGGGQAIDFDGVASGSARIVINNYAGGVLRSLGQDAVRPGQGAVVTNAGLITSDGLANNSFDGIDWQNKSGTVVNLTGGTISGLRHGITSDANVDVTNQVGATIIGRNGSGVGSDGTGIVTNFGLITGSWDGIAINGDGDGVDIDRIATVRNFGTIRGLSAAGVDSGRRANSAQGVAIGGGLVENATGALIEGQAQAILANLDTNPGGAAVGATTVVNLGTIRGLTGSAIQFVGRFADVIANAGTIAGNGTAIDMGGGDDTLNLFDGSTIIGLADGGADRDTINLAGTGGTLTQAINFERLNVVAGDWTIMPGSNFAEGTAIGVGTSLTGSAASLTGSIAIAGSLRVDQASDAIFGALLSGNGTFVKLGAGALTINDQLGFFGSTNIAAGRLLVAGTLASAVTVNSGAALVVASGGTIRSAGIAVDLNSAVLLNSGTIVSTGGIAVTTSANPGHTITNLASGTIAGGAGTAIRVQGVALSNAGTILGSVDLGYADPTSRSALPSIYTAAGGTIAGDLLFGTGNDTLVINTITTGVSGTIDGGLGINTVVLDRSGGGVFGGATNFDGLSILTGGWRLLDAQSYFAGTTITTNTALTTAFSFGGNVLNNGTLTFDPATNLAYTGTISGVGNFVKAGGGTLTIGAQSYTGATSVIGGTLALTGTLASQQYGVATGASLTSTALATISTTGTSLSIVNAGTIANTAVGGRAVNITATAGLPTIAITNLAGGVITSADDTVRINFNPTGGDVLVDNLGIIQTTAGGQAIDFDAAASGSARIVINNYASGVLRSFGQDAVRPGQGAVVTNAGLIFSDGLANNSFDGIDWQNKFGTVVNLTGGTISGLRHGVTSDVDVQVNNQAGATIIGRNGSGVGSDGTGTVVNLGLITGSWDGVAINGDGDGVDIDRIATVRNFGTIRGLSAAGVDSGGRANSAQGVAIGGGLVENAAGALIEGRAQGILANLDTNTGGAAVGATTVVNLGTIRGVTGSAIQFIGSFADVIANAGTIAGNGTAIDMGGGDDTLNLFDGSNIVGVADGGADRDTINLVGTGGTLTQAVNFERLNVVAGNWTIVPGSSFAEGTVIGAGTSLTANAASLIGSIANAGILRIDQSSDAASGARLTGSGTLVKAGAGTLTVNDQLGFFGPTNVAAGRLLVAGTLASAVTVNSGATLGGNGMVAALVVANGGTVAPGTSIGTLTVAGNYLQPPGSIYAAEIDATGAADRIAVGGTATLQPGARIVVTGALATPGTRYLFLTANGGLTGTYATTAPSTADAELRFGYSPSAVFADVARTGSSLGRTARTTNQGAVGGALAAIGLASAPFTQLSLLADDNAARAALDALSGEVHASLRTTLVKDGQAVARTAAERLLVETTGTNIWASFLGNYGGDANWNGAASVTRRSNGVVIGIDHGFDTARLGIAGGYTRQDTAIAARNSDVRSETGHVLAYGGVQVDAVTLNAGVGYAWSRNTTDRTVAFTGFADRLRATYDSDTLHGFGEARYSLPVGGGRIEPFAGIEMYRVTTLSFTENGGSAALRVARRSETYGFANIGLRATTPIVADVSAHGVIAWQHRITGSTPIADARFTGSPASFGIGGVALARDAVRLGLNLAWQPTPALRLAAGYDGQIGGGGSDSAIRASAALAF